MLRVTVFLMILSSFNFVDPGAEAFAKPFALCASPLISNAFVGTPLGSMAGGAEVVGIGQGSSFRVGFHKVYTLPSGQRKSTAISPVSVNSMKKCTAFMGSIS